MSDEHQSATAGRARGRRLLYPALVAVILLAIWQALVVGFELPPYLVPSPTEDARRWSPTASRSAWRCW